MDAKQFDDVLFRNNPGEKLNLYILFDVAVKLWRGGPPIRLAARYHTRYFPAGGTAHSQLQEPHFKAMGGKEHLEKGCKGLWSQCRKKKKKFVMFTLSEFDSFGGFII
jgi:hypothetical protein